MCQMAVYWVAVEREGGLDGNVLNIQQKEGVKRQCTK